MTGSCIRAEKDWPERTICISPEEETKDREGADAGAAAGHAGEDAAEEAAADQDDRLPEFEILDLVEGFTFVLPEKDKCFEIAWATLQLKNCLRLKFNL